MWTELVEASAKVAILQMDQQRSAKTQVRYNQIEKHHTMAERLLILNQKSQFERIQFGNLEIFIHN